MPYLGTDRKLQTRHHPDLPCYPSRTEELNRENTKTHGAEILSVHRAFSALCLRHALLPAVTNAKTVLSCSGSGVGSAHLSTFSTHRWLNPNADRQGDYTLYKHVGNGGHRVATRYVSQWETEAAVCVQTHHHQSSPPEHGVRGESGQSSCFKLITSRLFQYQERARKPRVN